MKNSLIIIIIFFTGIFLGMQQSIFLVFSRVDMILYSLYGLLFLVGIDIGSNPSAWLTLKTLNVRIVLVPLSIAAGSILGAGVIAPLFANFTAQDALAVGAGFGYYSLSSIIITQIKGDALGVIALLANLSREVLTLLLAPLLARIFGKLAPIAAAGATSMDTTLPVIVRASGKDYAIIAFFSGIVLTILVPLVVPLILSF